ncbi:nuclear fragile X mental retardation-interacting protein 1-domain-containing protein [Lipomyces japonicus]|uniref:nuclear fragile X mental retardation-interacting protein 1-domain-containing protein n=1 Tax=Lipomyces japonicus TaxID=56871 RepID=UPI0034CFF0CC
MDYIFGPPPPPPPKANNSLNEFRNIDNENDNDNNDDDDNEEEAASRAGSTSGVITVTGTNISLQTEEDIAKWIADRKKKWPTARRVEEKQVEMELQKIAELEAKKASRQQKEDVRQINLHEIRLSRNICKFYAKNGKCTRGSKCSFSHERLDHHDMPIKKYKRFDNPLKMPLFKRLVQSDWDKQDQEVLQFIEYLASHGILDRSKAL